MKFFILHISSVLLVHAQINGDPSKICADNQSHDDNERFRDRLKLDHQTGSLTITNIRTTDAGVYQLKIINSSSDSDETFSVSVRDVPAAELEEVKRKSVKEGESVTLDPGVVKHPNDVMMWYFNDTCIAEITGDLSKICTDDQCEHADGRFKNRLKVNHQTGSLTIINTRTTDAGLYKLEINSSSSISRLHNGSISISSFKSFSVAVIESGQSVAVICAGVGVLLLVSAAVNHTAGVINCHRNKAKKPGQNEHHVEYLSTNKAEISLLTVASESSPYPAETARATSPFLAI
ncbi:uncharacterized protein LOC127519798 isoform X2 [Ctenopharyngodon idella]|uniref:uncharacterized protein LOC127519798 isoform X2 n=1 Tax=Ctenopharyngodon idella TaxID=7959 RepID=UPI0022300C3B|nr:uncharacterized protein LOC127519798 isoform X2 [Ctenopharyngodon idella]